MRKFCKAYYLRELRQFSAWNSLCQKDDAGLADDTIVYLWDDLTLVESPLVTESNILVESVTPEWQTFCLSTLHFEVPDDFQYAYEHS